MKHKKHKHQHKSNKKKKKKYQSSSSSSSSSSEEEWVERPSSSSLKNNTTNPNPPKIESQSFMKPSEDDGFSFLDFALSSSSKRDKTKEIVEPKKTPILEQYPVGLYYPNRKNNEKSTEDSKPASINFRQPKSSSRSPEYSRYSHKSDIRPTSSWRKDKNLNSQTSRQSRKSRSPEYRESRSEYSDKRFRQPNSSSRSPEYSRYDHKTDQRHERSWRKDVSRSQSSGHKSKSPDYVRSARRRSKSPEQRRNRRSKSPEHSRSRRSRSKSPEHRRSRSKSPEHRRSRRSRSKSPNMNSESEYSNCEKDVQARKSYSSESTTEADARHPVNQEPKTPKVTHDDVNKIAAKLVKAEIMGNLVLVEKLKKQLEESRSQVSHDIPKTAPASQPRSNSNQGEERDDKVVQIREQNFKTKRKMELLEKKKLAFLGNNEDRWVPAESEKIFANVGDEYEEERSSKKKKIKQSDNGAQSNIQEHKRVSRMLDTCAFCLSSSNLKTRPVVIEQFSNDCYLAIPNQEPLVQHHCLIVAEEHCPCLTQTDPNTFSTIKEVCERLVDIFSKQDKTCVFFEMANNLKWNHMRIHCLPIPRHKGEMAPLYFQKAITDLESNTSQNRVLIKVEKNITKVVPKELDYFYVSFDWKKGFAHIIENRLSTTFAEEIVGGMLNLSPSLWRNPKPLTTENKMKLKLDFMKVYKS